MAILSVDQLKMICTVRSITKAQEANMASMVEAINKYGVQFGMHIPYNLAAFLGQIFVESAEFKYDQEIWGPTAQQKKYEGRKDLGNTQPGDGKKFKGHGPIQITGRYNTTRFHKWCKDNHERFGFPFPPNFINNPKLINTDPWEGISALWYWHVGNPDGKSLNRYAEENNQTMITRRVNGGLTHFDRRLEYQARAALVLLGYGVSADEVKRFQSDHVGVAGNPDGIIGDKTRAALHLAMRGKLPATSVIERTIDRVEQVPIPTEDIDKPWYKDGEGIKEIITTIGAPTILSFLTDIPTEKLLVIAGILVLSSLVWYFIRTRRVNEVKRAIDNLVRAPIQTINERTIIKVPDANAG